MNSIRIYFFLLFFWVAASRRPERTQEAPQHPLPLLGVRIAAFTPYKRLLSRATRSPKEPKPIVQGLPLFVCMRFQDLFHSPPGVLFAFPSRYWFTIGRSRVFSLGGWSPHLQTGLHVSRPTCRTLRPAIFLSHTGLSPCVAALSSAFC